MAKQKKQDVNFDELFKGLVENACDFVERSVKEFSKSPKQSLINFYTGIELFLKARLMKEHWSLLVRDSKRVDRNKFAQGDFVSPSFEEIIGRLKKVAGEAIHKNAYNTFDDLRKHRNMLVHFFHGTFEKNDPQEIRNILQSQGEAWIYLHGLLGITWQKTFGGWSHKIAHLNELFHCDKVFLDAKYDLLKPHLKIWQGKPLFDIVPCRRCNHESAFRFNIHNDLEKHLCFVCNQYYLKIHCPVCQQIIVLKDGNGRCDECGKEVAFNEVMEKYASARWRGKNIEGIWCGACEHPEKSIVPNADGTMMFCVVCGQHFKHNEIIECKYCHERYAGSRPSTTECLGCKSQGIVKNK